MLLLALLAVMSPVAAWAQADYPNRPVRIVVAYAAGGVADVMARLIATPLRAALGQSFVVENKPGAGGMIGTQACAGAPPDGYTLCMGSQSSLVLAPMLLKDATYDALGSFSPITLLAYLPNVVVVRPQLGVRSPDSLIAWIKAHPGAGWGTSGVGTTNHLAAVYLNKMHGTQIEHVAYRGGILAVEDVLAGQIPMAMDQISSTIGHVKAGNLVAVLQSGVTRNAALPDVPTFAETVLPRLKQDSFQALLGPAGLPDAVVGRLSNAVRRIVIEDGEVNRKIVELGGVPLADTPDDFAQILRDNVTIYRELVALAGMQR